MSYPPWKQKIDDQRRSSEEVAERERLAVINSYKCDYQFCGIHPSNVYPEYSGATKRYKAVDFETCNKCDGEYCQEHIHHNICIYCAQGKTPFHVLKKRKEKIWMSFFVPLGCLSLILITPLFGVALDFIFGKPIIAPMLLIGLTGILILGGLLVVSSKILN